MARSCSHRMSARVLEAAGFLTIKGDERHAGEYEATEPESTGHPTVDSRRSRSYLARVRLVLWQRAHEDPVTPCGTFPARACTMTPTVTYPTRAT
jgi:hypothetical protein